VNSILPRVAREIRPQWRAVVAILAVDLAATPIFLLTPVPLKIAVDSVLGTRPLSSPLRAITPSWVQSSDDAMLLLAAALLLLVVMLGQVQQAGADVLRARTSEAMTLQLRARMFDHAQRLSLGYHDRRSSADSIYRIQYDAMSVAGLTVDGVIPLATSAIAFVAMVYVTAKIDVALAAVALVVAPVLLVVTRLYRRRAKVLYRRAKEVESSALGVVQEALTSLRVVKAFGRENHENHRFVSRAALGVAARIRIAMTDSLFGALIDLTIAVGTCAVLFIGVRAVQSHTISLGELLLVMGYLAQLYLPLKTMSRTIGQLQSSYTGAERSFELLDESRDAPEPRNALRVHRAEGKLEFRNVVFGYDDGPPVLDDVSFAIEAGTSLGIAGPTGAGKTTLIGLLARLYDPVAGSIHLDDVDLRDMAVADLRNQFAIVLQEPVLFSASIAENIAYARPEAQWDEIEAAAHAANAYEFIEQLPMGFDTLVGERGMRLSGGQRQRVSLARAYLKDAPILVLDEPTSAVDLATEDVMLTAMRGLMIGRTTLVIAHRPNTLDGCDQRLEIDHGRVVVAPRKPRRRSTPRAATASSRAPSRRPARSRA